jgi:hypothetical protein
MGEDFPEKYGGYVGSSFVSSGESFDPSCYSVNEN